MNTMHSVLLKELVDEFSLEIVHKATDFEKVRLTVEDISRPGLQLAGYFYHFEPMRLQVMGNMEASYMEKLSDAEKAITYDRLFSYKFPAFLVARNIHVDPQMVEMAQKHNVTLLRSKDATSTIVSAIITYLKSALAPRITRHAVLMEIYGEGTLILGDSGIGKSETAVELIARGHERYEQREAELTPEIMRSLEHMILLRNVDTFWMEHIDSMEELKRGIGLRAYGNQDPVVAYRNVGSDMFDGMTEAIREDTARQILTVVIRSQEETKREQTAKITATSGATDGTDKKQPVRKKEKAKPNDPCPCGSGKKYKNCCGDVRKQ